MKVERRVEAKGEDDFLREGVRAYFLGEGYVEESEAPEAAQVFRNEPRGIDAALSSRVEKLPRALTVRYGPEHEGDRPRSIWLQYDLRTRWRLLTRLDLLFFRLEAEDLERYLESGHRGDVISRLDRLRRPIGMAVMVNVVLAAMLVAFIGRLVGFSLPLLIGAAVIVALVNLVSIIGFADLVIEGMESLEH